MTTELNLTIRAETAHQALVELAEISRRAAKELGVAPTPADTGPAQPELPLNASAKGNGGDEPTPPAKRSRRTPVATAASDAEGVGLDRGAIIKGLTEIYMRAEAEVRDKIVTFRDGHGVQRLKDLKDEALPGAAALLTQLQSLEAANP